MDMQYKWFLRRCGPHQIANAILDLAEDRVSVGRSNFAAVDAPSYVVSRLHATFKFRNGGWTITDERSVNGVHIFGGMKIPPEQEHRLSVGDRVGFGVPITMTNDEHCYIYELARIKKCPDDKDNSKDDIVMEDDPIVNDDLDAALLTSECRVTLVKCDSRQFALPSSVRWLRKAHVLAPEPVQSPISEEPVIEDDLAPINQSKRRIKKTIARIQVVDLSSDEDEGSSNCPVIKDSPGSPTMDNRLDQPSTSGLHRGNIQQAVRDSPLPQNFSRVVNMPKNHPRQSPLPPKENSFDQPDTSGLSRGSLQRIVREPANVSPVVKAQPLSPAHLPLKKYLHGQPSTSICTGGTIRVNRGTRSPPSPEMPQMYDKLDSMSGEESDDGPRSPKKVVATSRLASVIDSDSDCVQTKVLPPPEDHLNRLNVPTTSIQQCSVIISTQFVAEKTVGEHNSEISLQDDSNGHGRGRTGATTSLKCAADKSSNARSTKSDRQDETVVAVNSDIGCHYLNCETTRASHVDQQVSSETVIIASGTRSTFSSTNSLVQCPKTKTVRGLCRRELGDGSCSLKSPQSLLSVCPEAAPNVLTMGSLKRKSETDQQLSLNKKKSADKNPFPGGKSSSDGTAKTSMAMPQLSKLRHNEAKSGGNRNSQIKGSKSLTTTSSLRETSRDHTKGVLAPSKPIGHVMGSTTSSREDSVQAAAAPVCDLLNSAFKRKTSCSEPMTSKFNRIGDTGHSSSKSRTDSTIKGDHLIKHDAIQKISDQPSSIRMSNDLAGAVPNAHKGVPACQPDHILDKLKNIHPVLPPSEAGFCGLHKKARKKSPNICNEMTSAVVESMQRNDNLLRRPSIDCMHSDVNRLSDKGLQLGQELLSSPNCTEPSSRLQRLIHPANDRVSSVGGQSHVEAVVVPIFRRVTSDTMSSCSSPGRLHIDVDADSQIERQSPPPVAGDGGNVGELFEIDKISNRSNACHSSESDGDSDRNLASPLPNQELFGYSQEDEVIIISSDDDDDDAGGIGGDAYIPIKDIALKIEKDDNEPMVSDHEWDHVFQGGSFFDENPVCDEMVDKYAEKNVDRVIVPSPTFPVPVVAAATIVSIEQTSPKTAVPSATASTTNESQDSIEAQLKAIFGDDSPPKETLQEPIREPPEFLSPAFEVRSNLTRPISPVNKGTGGIWTAAGARGIIDQPSTSCGLDADRQTERVTLAKKVPQGIVAGASGQRGPPKRVTFQEKEAVVNDRTKQFGNESTQHDEDDDRYFPEPSQNFYKDLSSDDDAKKVPQGIVAGASGQQAPPKRVAFQEREAVVNDRTEQFGNESTQHDKDDDRYFPELSQNFYENLSSNDDDADRDVDAGGGRHANNPEEALSSDRPDGSSMTSTFYSSKTDSKAASGQRVNDRLKHSTNSWGVPRHYTAPQPLPIGRRSRMPLLDRIIAVPAPSKVAGSGQASRVHVVKPMTPKVSATKQKLKQKMNFRVPIPGAGFGDKGWKDRKKVVGLGVHGPLSTGNEVISPLDGFDTFAQPSNSSGFDGRQHTQCLPTPSLKKQPAIKQKEVASRSDLLTETIKESPGPVPSRPKLAEKRKVVAIPALPLTKRVRADQRLSGKGTLECVGDAGPSSRMPVDVGCSASASSRVPSAGSPESVAVVQHRKMSFTDLQKDRMMLTPAQRRQQGLPPMEGANGAPPPRNPDLHSSGERSVANGLITYVHQNTLQADEVVKATDRIVYHILNWRVSWLAEQSKFDNLPPILATGTKDGNLELKPLRPIYRNHQHYVNTFEALLYHELWAEVTNDYRCTESRLKLQMVQVTPSGSTPDKAFENYLCYGAVRQNDDKLKKYLQDGFLVAVDIPIIEKGKSNTAIKLFAIVESCQKMTQHWVQQNWKGLPQLRNLPAQDLQNWTVLSFILKTKYKMPLVNKAKLLEMRLLTYIRPKLRLFQILHYLPLSNFAGQLLQPDAKLNDLPALPPKEKTVHIPDLFFNTVQKHAILRTAEACISTGSAPKVCLIQGPPGTGKSTVVVGLVYQLVFGNIINSRDLPRPQILLCAPSNAAVDELVQKLLRCRKALEKSHELELKIIRLGQQGQANPETKAYSLDELIDQNLTCADRALARKKSELCQIESTIDINREGLNKAVTHVATSQRAIVEAETIKQKIEEFKVQRLETLRKIEKLKSCSHEGDKRAYFRVRDQIIINADVICTTLGGCSSSGLEVINRNDNSRPFICIIDEATQCIEPESLLPLQFGITKLVLVGDHQQLQPTVLSKVSTDMCLGLSLFERLHDQPHSADLSIMLLRQYRMLPELSLYPSKTFYNGRLQNSEEVKTRFATYPYRPYILLNVKDSEEHQTNSGYSNPKEALFVVKLCEMLKSKNIDVSIGVITFYKQQKYCITHQLSQSAINMTGAGAIDVNTVDGFQGREKDVIIVSAVRANNSNSIGFLNDRRRLNVSLTRSRCGLYICGHLSTLSKIDNRQLWTKLIKDATKRQCAINVTSSFDCKAIEQAIRKCV